MIPLLVWSKDRACQLDCLLRSLERFSPDTFAPVVIVKTTSDDYLEAYSRLRYELGVPLLYEGTDGTFYELTYDLIQLCGEKKFAFSTDDTILYRKPSTPVLEACQSAAIFSLRYGLNTVVQDYHTGRKQPVLNRPAIHPGMGDVIAWCWRDYHPLNNYGYPFGLDLHIYKTDMLQGIVGDESFNSSNELETLLFNKRGMAPPYMGSYDESIAVNVPVNNISGITRGGEDFGISIEELNNRYLAGQRIDLDSLCSHEIVGSHQELPVHFTLEKRENG